ncbi:MAG: hypothetical protein ACK4M3_02465 [Pyrobaculum sp.]
MSFCRGNLLAAVAIIMSLFFPVSYVEISIDGAEKVYPPGVNFTITYIHSIEKTAVVEHYVTTAGGIYLDGRLYVGSRLHYYFISINKAAVVLEKPYHVEKDLAIEIKTVPLAGYVVHVFR